MKKTITRLALIMAMVMSPLLFLNVAHAQTTGTLTFVFTTTSTGGYTPNNCLAAWIEDASGTFIKTKFKYCNSGNGNTHLATWVAKSGSNVVDATTGTTRTNGQLTLVWNGTDVSTALVADGTYKVWLEFAFASSLTTGKVTTSFSFTKGVNADHQTPANMTNFTGMTLDWVPTFVGVAENQEKANFTVSPNPVNNQSTINYSLNDYSDVSISLYDISGKLVKVILDENQNAGTYNLPLSMNGTIEPGIYFVKMYTGNTQHTERIIITK